MRRTISANGARHAPHSATLTATTQRGVATGTRLVVPREIEPRVQAGDLIGVAVEHQCWCPRREQASAELSFARLAPARVIDFRIHVRVEPVLLRRRHVPARERPLVREMDADDRLRALEAVLPRHDDANRRAVLVRQHLAVDAHGDERQRVRGLLDREALAIGPLENGILDAGHLVPIRERQELHELGRRLRLEALQQIGQR